MLMPDVNILLYAHRAESRYHQKYATWLIEAIKNKTALALSEPVLSGFIRIATNSKIFKPASTIEQCFNFITEISNQPRVIKLRPGDMHWTIFQKLCNDYQLEAKLVADAYHAALAIEYNCQWITADTDFARFEGVLSWKHL